MTLKQSHAPRITRAAMQRTMRLLDMEYKPSELADELGISAKTIYNTYLPAGLPHRRDKADNIWIVGTVFVEWAKHVLDKNSRYAHQRKEPMGENQGYCMKCKNVADFQTVTQRREMSNSRVMVYGTCSVCGGKITTLKKGTPNDKP